MLAFGLAIPAAFAQDPPPDLAKRIAAVESAAQEAQSNYTYRQSVTLDELDVLGIRSSPNAYPAMIALLASGAIRTEPLTSHVYPLADVATAFGALERREAIRPILIT